MSNKEDNLLARLNALKPSSVTLTNTNPTIDVETSQPQSVEDKLAERLKTLRAGGTPQNSTPRESISSPAEVLTARIQDEVATERDPIRDWQQQDGDDDQTLEDLLAELGPDDQWKLDPDDPKHIEMLLLEARDALPEESTTSPGNPQHNKDSDREPHSEQDDHKSDQQDEEEANEYVKRLLAEISREEADNNSDPSAPPTQQDEEEETEEAQQETSLLNLPSTPSTTLPQHPSSSSHHHPAQPQDTDTDLQSRFANLSLPSTSSLPSTPTTNPSTAKAKVTAHLKPKAKAAAYTDEEVDSWCCICNEDGEVRCLGCDGDLYCQACWDEGHGEGPGRERGHRAVQFNRRGPVGVA